MARKAYARRYAQAVFEIALAQKELDKWQSDLQQLAVAALQPGFLPALESPRLTLKDKNQLLSRLGDINPMALNLVRLLISRTSVGIIGRIADEYQHLLYQHRGIEPAEVITAVPVDDRDKLKLTESLSSLVGKKVVLRSSVDPAIIGGIIARVGGKLLDGSTRSKLQALRRDLGAADRR